MGLPVNPGTFTFRNTGVWAGGPIVKNKLFVFGNYENEKTSGPLHTFRANTGGEPVGGNVSRVLASDLDTLSAYLKQNFSYETGGFDNLPSETPAKRYLFRTDYNLNNRNKISFRYNQLDSSDGKAHVWLERRPAWAGRSARISCPSRRPTTTSSKTSSRASANGTR